MEELLLKYIEEKASPAEIRLVEDWITASVENQRYFNELKAKHLANTFERTSASVNVEKELAVFKTFQRKKGRIRPFSSSLMKYAAAVMLLLGFAGWFYLGNRNALSDERQANAITLQTEDGTIEIIPGERREVLRGENGELIGQQIQDRLVYGKANNTSTISYNTLTVPYGKRFNLVLSDGSSIFLNSGTSIRYPVSFPEDADREVTIKGEAFFEIARDTLHPFIVNANDMNVRVLGTKFNVSAYEEDPAVHTVLVEGSVSLYEGENYETSTKTLLRPGHKGTWNKQDHTIDVEETEVSVYTSWLKGEMVFKHMKLNDILKKLERRYNVRIIQPEGTIGNMYFTASFSDEQSITQVLETFKEHYGIDYRINEDEITISTNPNRTINEENK